MVQLGWSQRGYIKPLSRGLWEWYCWQQVAVWLLYFSPGLASLVPFLALFFLLELVLHMKPSSANPRRISPSNATCLIYINQIKLCRTVDVTVA